MGPGEEEQEFSEQTGDVGSGDTGYADQTYDTAGYDVPSDSGYESSMSYESDPGGACYEPGTEPGEPNASYEPGTEPGKPNACYEPGTDSEPTSQAKQDCMARCEEIFNQCIKTSTDGGMQCMAQRSFCLQNCA
jgi:hypothetical protein